MTDDTFVKRRRWTRLLLGAGAILPLMLLSSWMRASSSPSRTRGLIVMAILLVPTITAIVLPRRAVRATIAILSAGSIYTAFLLAWSLRETYRVVTAGPHVSPSRIAGSVALTLVLLLPIPLSLILLWPLRRREESLAT